MRNFWTCVSNGKYSVGCSGQTVYVYDSSGSEIKRFRDLIYAYNAVFSPDGRLLVVKSTEGRIAVYDMDSLTLLKKFRFSKEDAGQDDGMCFSELGELFYNIERFPDVLTTRLAIYNTKDFSLKGYLFENKHEICLDQIEIVDGVCYLLGFKRNGDEDNIDFVSKMENEELTEFTPILENDYWFYCYFNDLKQSGFTKKTFENLFTYLEGNYDLDELKRSNYSLKELFDKYTLKKE